MKPAGFLKKIAPNTPDWILGGGILLASLWLVVLPTELAQALTGGDFLRPGALMWIVRSFYIFGYGLSLSLISPWAGSSVAEFPFRLVVVLSGLLICSPACFGLGALLSAGKKAALTLGLTLLVVQILASCYAVTVILYSD